MAVLNGLRDDINAHYGYRNGGPCINWGPCGRFAKAFRQQWNARFREKINIAFVMAPDGLCHHVVLSFSDGSYLDGGKSVMSEEKLLTLYGHDDRIEEMVQYDESLLDQRVGGLNREHYSWCPNYSDTLAARLIEKHLAHLASDFDESAKGQWEWVSALRLSHLPPWKSENDIGSPVARTANLLATGVDMSVGEESRGNDGHADLHDIPTKSATWTPQSQIGVSPDPTCL
jgi:hypothetical protein